jgi:hypothetical protein
MSIETVSRRGMLAGAGAAAAGAALMLSASPAAARDDGDAGLTGSWLLDRVDASDPTQHIATIISFAGGEVFLSRDHNPPGPPGYGTWSGKGKHFTFTFLTSGGGGPQTFLATVTGSGKLEGKTVSGSYTVALTDGSGGSLGNSSGTFTGTRLKA